MEGHSVYGTLVNDKKQGARTSLYSYNSWQLVLIKILFFLWFWTWTFKSSSLAIDLSKMCLWRTSHASRCTRSSCTIKKMNDVLSNHITLIQLLIKQAKQFQLA
jgi:hypothetical protein